MSLAELPSIARFHWRQLRDVGSSLAVQGSTHFSKEVAVNPTHQTQGVAPIQCPQVGEEHGRDKEKVRQGHTKILKVTARV